jgi:hypothetical protein
MLPFVFLTLSGFKVEMPDLTIRKDISDARHWLDSYDLKIGEALIEVKSRPFAFTSPRDWPNNRLPAFLDTTKKWEAKSVKPFAYVFISKPTGGMIATCSTEAASGRWSSVQRFDRVRKFNEDFYTVKREHLVSMQTLVEALRKEVPGDGR